MSSLVLTVKGRLCAPVWIWGDGDALFVEAPASLEENLASRLDRYVISDDVTIDVVADEALWHVAGDPHAAGRHVKRLGIPGVDVTALPDGLVESSSDDVAFWRIARGVPAWGAELDEHTLPHEAGLDATSVDFHKGCYVGQEVVSRVESAGRMNRRLVGFRITAPTPLPAGPLSLSGDGAQVGRITSHAAKSDRIVALGYIPFSSTERKFDVVDETGACLGTAERCEFPLISE